LAEQGPAPALEVQRVPFAHPDAQRLAADVQAEYVQIYGAGDQTPLADHMFEPPGGIFLVAYAAGEPVAMGGWRVRPDVTELVGSTVAEIKRMYVVPQWRGTGAARFMLARLEVTAREAGLAMMVLETGQPQAAAVALYRRAGYTDTVRFGYYADEEQAVYLGKPLSEAEPSTQPVTRPSN
jgi:GNAT superfamily N-acetyltransferase